MGTRLINTITLSDGRITPLKASLAIIPCLLVGGWGNSIFEPKLIALLLAVTLFSAQLARELTIGSSPRPPLFANGLWALAIFQAIGLLHTPNLGSGLLTLGLSVSWLVITLFVWRSRLEPQDMGTVAVPLTVLGLLATLPDTLFGLSILSPYSPRGGLIGTKNALSVFLVQMVPLLLIKLDLSTKARPFHRTTRGALMLLLTLSLYMVAMSRTRSAWVMILVYLVGFALMHRAKRGKCSSSMPRDLFVATSSALALAYFLPSTLKWIDSPSPYLKSLVSLVSLDSSSGRDHLWSVALSMIRQSPWNGWGTGAYASQWPSQIGFAGTDPTNFAFLRLDLPLFNDYLQCVVENGVLVGALFFSLIFILPLRLFQKQLTSIQPANPHVMALGLMCVATSVTAFTDYPFHRVETSLFFMCALGIVIREDRLANAGRWKLLFASTYGVTGLFALGLAMKLICAFWLRAVPQHEISPSSLARSIAWWPYDTFYTSSSVQKLIDTGRTEDASRLVELRRQFWPSDPEGFLMLGTLLESRGDVPAANTAYSRGRYFVEQGRCYGPGMRAYLAFRKKNQEALGGYDEAAEISNCATRKMAKQSRTPS